jgi:hypothetical protein
MIDDEKSLSSRKSPLLYAVSADEDHGTVDICVFDHDTGLTACLYLPPEFAEQMAASIVHQIQLLSK